MNLFRRTATAMAALSTAALLGACATTEPAIPVPAPIETPVDAAAVPVIDTAKFERDREAILAMTGDYKVTFDFTETVSFVEGYELKEPKLSGGYEVVRVIEDTGDFISLQHILVVGGDQKFPIKHWRQDWQYEPESVLVFIGGNAWETREVPEGERAGKWSQTVYQVDDSPRYGAVGAWDYKDGISAWTPPQEWRPLPRRDMTTRDDYHAVDAVNRHVITPFGWVHEQDNSKLILDGEPQALVREVGINTYRVDSEFDASIATDYMTATSDFWAIVRDEWTGIEAEYPQFAITIQGETEEMYGPVLSLAGDVAGGLKTTEEAGAEARTVIRELVTPEIGELAERLRPTTTLASTY
ncbi:MAG: hypothetical protein MRY64_16970 [Hyphomonadaceae bacterium]|nr:hypothetical protein [Hyphomonadaceae bacterium]